MNNRNLFLIVLETGKSKTEVLAGAPFFLLAAFSHAGAEELSEVSFIRIFIPS